MEDNQNELVALACLICDELKKLVGPGATPERLALQCPRLRKLAGVGFASSVVEAGYIVDRYLDYSINGLTGLFWFEGGERPAGDLKPLLNKLLKRRCQGSAELRRGEVIFSLGISCSIEKWRRPHGPEWHFLYILAQSMTDSLPDHQTV
jgi:hypothetical protein